MRSLGLVASALLALLVVPSLVRSLAAHGLVRTNYRGAPLPAPAGVVIPVCALAALAPLALLQRLIGARILDAAVLPAAAFAIGVSLLGLLDDLVGSREPRARGWRGHARAIAAGRFSTGAAKAVGTLGLAALVLLAPGAHANGALLGDRRSLAAYVVAAGVLVVATNLFNLLDLRPGRSLKALALLGAGLTVGALDAQPLFTLGAFLGAPLVLLPLDLRERAMLGDTGSNALGALAGLWLVLTLSTLGQAIALAAMALVTVYGEFRSISGWIERTPGIRHLDSLGRVSHA